MRCQLRTRSRRRCVVACGFASRRVVTAVSVCCSHGARSALVILDVLIRCA